MNHVYMHTRRTESRVTRARMSAHETTPRQAASSRVLASSTTSYPLNRLLGPTILSVEELVMRMEALQP